MSGVIEDILNKLKECDDFHDRCDCLLEHDEITYLLDYIQQKENIIKEVREYIEKNIDNEVVHNWYLTNEEAHELLEILDKGDKGE